jgi:hypothetical protein
MTQTQWNQLVQSDVNRLIAAVMTKRLVREANHQSLCALCQASRDQTPYSHIYPLTR